jgi:TatD DNase family protein
MAAGSSIRVKLIDTHAHLEDVTDLREAIRRAAKVGVIAILAVGSNYKSNLWVMHESSKYEVEGLRIYPALGIHPCELDGTNIEETINFIEENVDKTVALGEIGLDYWYRDARKNESKREFQRKVFRRMLDIARRNDKPVSIHSRGAWIDSINMTVEMGVKRAVFHWFSGSIEDLKKILDYGYYVSATPAAAYSKEHRKIIAKAPLENIVLETDSPVVYSGEEAEPAHIIKALNAVAELKNEEVSVVAEETTKNAKQIFGIN